MTSGGNEKTLENVNFSDVFKKLSKDQLRFVVAMQECNSKKEAAKMIGLNPNSVYNWGDEVDEAIMALALDITQSAREMRKKALAKAVAVKLAALDSDDERIRQAAATEIIEAELGKAKQAMDLTTGGDKIFVTLKSGDEEVTVAFDEAGLKRLSMNSTRLEIL